MAYVEKVKWKNGAPSEHKYNELDAALRSMRETNPILSIVSSELYDENNKLIATYEMLEGVKMVEQIKEIEVSEETYNYMTGSGKTFFDMYSEWGVNGNAQLDNALNELNGLEWTNGATHYLTGLLKGEMKLVKKEKFYRIVLPEVFHTDGGMLWNYLFMGLTDTHRPTLECTDNKGNIYTFPESKLKHFPKWAQELAEEVE